MRKFFSHLAICVTAILVIALCGCEDLGAYADRDDYYSSFGNVILIDSVSREEIPKSVSEYFYNEESRKDFLEGEERILPAEYLYVAIPLNRSIDMDSLALYMHSEDDVTVYISVYVIGEKEWKEITGKANEEPSAGGSGADTSDPETGEITYGEPSLESKIGDTGVHLQNGKWSSFVLDVFTVSGTTQKSIQIEQGQYLLLQIQNNALGDGKQPYVDPESGLALARAKITMTNLLIRALDVGRGDNALGGD